MSYCETVVDLARNAKIPDDLPIIFAFGDAHAGVSWFPIFGKWRERLWSERDPLVWGVGERRHFGRISDLPSLDIAWKRKRRRAPCGGEI